MNAPAHPFASDLTLPLTEIDVADPKRFELDEPFQHHEIADLITAEL